MTTNSLARGARGGGIVIIGQFAKIAIQMLGVVILSRLLTPGDFGLIAMVAVFVALGDLLRDFGMSTAALQARSLSHQQASNMFWANTVLGTTAAVIVAASAPLLSAFYDEPRLVVLAPAMAITLLLSGLQAQVQVQLARAGRYGILAGTDVTAQLIALLVAIVAATVGFDYWALAAQAIVGAGAVLTSRLALARWIPSRPRRGHDSGHLLRAGGQFGLAQILTFAANNADTVSIGARWGPTNLGYYSRAFQLYALPRFGILDPLTQVAIPAVNQGIAAGRRASEMLLKLQAVLTTVVGWIYLVAATIAPWLLPVALGDDWHPSVGVFVALALGGVFAPLGTVAYWSFVLDHRSRELVHLHIVTKPMTVLLVLCGVPFGIEAVAWLYTMSLALSWPINLIWLHRIGAQNSWHFFKSGLRFVIATYSAYICSQIVTATTPLDSGSSAIAATICASITYFLVVYFSPAGSSDLLFVARTMRSAMFSASPSSTRNIDASVS